MRTPAMGVVKGMSDRYSAAEAPQMLMVSGSLTPSAENTSATIWVSRK